MTDAGLYPDPRTEDSMTDSEASSIDRIRATAFAVLLTSVMLMTACSGPFVLLPGGELEGQVESAPSQWGFTDEVSTVQLESQPSDPYSVNIWATSTGESIYLHAGANRARWVEHIEVDPRVRLRVGDRIFELVAMRVTAAEEFSRFADAYEAKYGSRPRNETVSEVYAYRLEAR